MPPVPREETGLVRSLTLADTTALVVGTGALTVSLGASSFTVNIDSTNQTLAGIRDAINDAIKNVRINRTVIMVAHRLTSLSDADRIFVFDGGRIADLEIALPAGA